MRKLQRQFCLPAFIMSFVLIAGCSDDEGIIGNGDGETGDEQAYAGLCDDVECIEHAHCDPETGGCVCDEGYRLEDDECVKEAAGAGDREADDADGDVEGVTDGDEEGVADGDGEGVADGDEEGETDGDGEIEEEAPDLCADVVCREPGLCEESLACNPATGECEATYTADGTGCDDGLACTGNDSCDGSGNCSGERIACEENEYCAEPDAECECRVGYAREEVAGDCEEQDILADMDDLALGAESFWNGSDGSGDFTSGSVTFNNNYDDTYGSWDGFSYSNITDTETPGWVNQYSAMTGGYANPSTYAVAFYSAWAAEKPTAAINDAGDGVVLAGAYVTNAVYAYYSMRDGDEFAKKFGGESGDDPDWFLLTISGVTSTGKRTRNSVEFYLADYRFVNNGDDYIVADWSWVELDSLGPVTALEFELSSSDVGEWGMNTPGYFAIDSIVRE